MSVLHIIKTIIQKNDEIEGEIVIGTMSMSYQNLREIKVAYRTGVIFLVFHSIGGKDEAA